MAPILLRQKLKIPPGWARAIARPRLYAVLDRHRHVALVAGPGYGKTSLLAAWSQAHPCAWVSLDGDDVDPASFLLHVIAACEKAIAGFATEARGMLAHAGERAGARAALAVLLADLDEQCDEAAPLCLVLDDYHLAASPLLDDLLARLIRLLPPALRLVLASQGPLAAELLALVGSQRLALIDQTALAFDRSELERLRPPAELEKLLADTGGWPAALEQGPAVLDAYLRQAVDADARRLLQQLALVDGFEAGSCETLFGEALSPQRREDWLARGILLDPGDGRLAVAQPMRGMWRRRFQADTPPAERAAVWARIGEGLWASQPLVALRAWLEAGQAEVAAERLAGVAEAWLSAGRLEPLAGALELLGPAASRPELQLAAGELYRRLGDVGLAEAALQRARAGYRDEAAGTARVRLRQATLAAGKGEVEAARAHLASIPPGADVDPVELANLEGGLALLSGDLDTARQHFERSLGLVADAYQRARAIHNLGACYTAMGEYRRALDAYDGGIALAWPPLVWMTPVNRALVLVYLQRVPEAQAAAAAALDLVRRFKLQREEGYALRILGHVHAVAGEPEAARACFETAELLARRMQDPLGLAHSLNFQAELSCRQGDPARALELVARVEETLGAAGTVPEFVQTRVRALLLAGREAEARPLLEELGALARHGSNAPLQAEIAELEALAAGTSPPLPASTPPARAPELTVRCFHTNRVWRGGAAMTAGNHGTWIAEREWQTAKAKQLLMFLLHTPEGATKAGLFEALYPNEPRSDSAINMTLLRLRKALEPALEKGQFSRYILRMDGRYTFNRQVAYELDSASFEAALRAARPGSPDEARHLQAALDLYTGPFLPGVELDWAVALRTRYRDRALEACRRWLALCEDRPGEALAVVQRALEVEPLSVEFNRELLLRHLEAEEPHRALEHFQLCRRRFRDALGLEPPADLGELVSGLE